MDSLYEAMSKYLFYETSKRLRESQIKPDLYELNLDLKEVYLHRQHKWKQYPCVRLQLFDSISLKNADLIEIKGIGSEIEASFNEVNTLICTKIFRLKPKESYYYNFSRNSRAMHGAHLFYNEVHPIAMINELHGVPSFFKMSEKQKERIFQKLVDQAVFRMFKNLIDFYEGKPQVPAMATFWKYLFSEKNAIQQERRS